MSFGFDQIHEGGGTSTSFISTTKKREPETPARADVSLVQDRYNPHMLPESLLSCRPSQHTVKAVFL